MFLDGLLLCQAYCPDWRMRKHYRLQSQEASVVRTGQILREADDQSWRKTPPPGLSRSSMESGTECTRETATNAPSHEVGHSKQRGVLRTGTLV